jgi:hypothetical protein
MSTYFKDDLNEDNNNSTSSLNKFYKYFQATNDKIQYFKYERWTVVVILSFFYLIRLILTGGNF